MKLEERPQVQSSAQREFVVQCVWKHETTERFNILCVNSPRGKLGLCLMTGGEDGQVRWYDLNSIKNGSGTKMNPQIVLETKSGPIQNIAVRDITKFNENDLIVADSCGVLTVFCNQQILSRQKLYESSINCMQILQDSTNNMAVITSDETGVISATLPSCPLWKVNLNNIKVNRPLPELIHVTSMLTCDLINQHNHVGSYVLAGDSAKQLHVLSQGSVVLTLTVPSIVTSMCQGRFVNQDQISTEGQSSDQSSSQVAIATESGAIYIFYNFTLSEDEYANCHHPVTCVRTLQVSDTPLDVLLCAGHFNALKFYFDGKIASSFMTSDWINSMDTADIDNDGHVEVVVGCMDSTVYALKVKD